MFNIRTLVRFRSYYRNTYSIVNALEQSPFVRLISMLGLIAVLVSLFWQWSEIQKGKFHRRAEAISRSWSIVINIAPGNSGKVAALEYLAKSGQSLNGIDVSCIRMTDGKAPCRTKTYLRGLNLSKTKMGQTVFLNNANFTGSSLPASSFQGAQLDNAILSYSNLGLSNFQESSLIGTNFYNSNLSNTDFRGAFLKNNNFAKANLTGAKFDKKVKQNLILNDTWAYAEDPPIGVNVQYLCSPEPKDEPKTTLGRPPDNTCKKIF